MTLNEKKKKFIQTYKVLADMYTALCDEDEDFDAGSKIAAGLGRIASEVVYMRTDVEKDFSFEDLKFEGYHLEDDIDKNYRDVWFISNDNEDNSFHIYVPESVNITTVSAEDTKYIVIVEQLIGCQHHKTFVIDAKTWISDDEDLGIERNLQDMQDYISQLID